MTTVRTRVRRISEKETFDIEVLDNNGAAVPLDRHGVLESWPHEKATKNSKTVKEWQDKFSRAHPGYSAKVFKEDGTVAPPQTLLSTVRDTYEE